MKQFFALVLLCLLVAVPRVQAQSSEDQYVRIFNLIQEGDSLEHGGRLNQALAKYLEAQTALQKFQKINPNWNVTVVNFRLNYLAAQIGAISARVPANTLPAKAAAPSAGAAGPAAGSLDNQLNSLWGQVRQLQADKILLEAKLKESLAVQPAALDPRELVKAQEKINSLQKQADLLRVNLDQVKARSAQNPDPKLLAQSQQALAEANRKLGEQTDRASALTQEKLALQKKLDSLAPATWNAAALAATKKALEDANRQIAQQKEITANLAAEKEALQARLGAGAKGGDSAAALRAENQLLKKQLADLRASPPPAGKAASAELQLAQAQAQIAKLQSDKEILHLEKTALENRVRQLSAAALAADKAPAPAAPPAVAAAPAPLPAARPEDALRLKQLERERDELQKKLEAANKELYGKTSKRVANHVVEMENQIAILRARLEVFEARQVPYTASELELFKRPEVKLAAADPQAGKKSVNSLPPGSAGLVADAQRLFAARQYDKAEDKYMQVLRQDDKNVLTLANLAAIQLEREHLDDAEKHIKQAVALAPGDAYSLGILGQVKFRQEKYEEALDALSRAAKLDPQNAEIQNYLGITLSEKGLRGPAETALRKAIQLEPNYASAHHNLAVIYLTQHPPLVELARWHYQKALAAGHAHNANLEKTFATQTTADAR